MLYTTLIKGFGVERNLAGALEVFREMPKEGVPYNTITFNSVMDACVKCSDIQTAESILREMMAPGSAYEPDLITFSTLLKGYCYEGDIDKALQVAETIKARGLRCDELVYNTLMDGCVKVGDIAAGVGLFEEMVQSGSKPSGITHSILMRLYMRTGPQNWSEDDAAKALADLYDHHGIPLPAWNDRTGRLGSRKWQPRAPATRWGRRGSGGSGTPVCSPASKDAGYYDDGSWSGWHGPCASSSAALGGWNGWGDASDRQCLNHECYWEPSAPSTPFGGSGSPTHCSANQLTAEMLGGGGGPFCLSPGAGGVSETPVKMVGGYGCVGSPFGPSSPQSIDPLCGNNMNFVAFPPPNSEPSASAMPHVMSPTGVPISSQALPHAIHQSMSYAMPQTMPQTMQAAMQQTMPAATMPASTPQTHAMSQVMSQMIPQMVPPTMPQMMPSAMPQTSHVAAPQEFTAFCASQDWQTQGGGGDGNVYPEAYFEDWSR